MSTSFTEFLREQAAKREQATAKRQEILSEWFDSLHRLYGQVREWLRSSDPDGILKLEDSRWEVREEGLGRYEAPRLDIKGLGRWVGLVPKGRYTVATAYPPQSSSPQRAAGRVDITNEVQRHVLYRFTTDTGDEWVIDDQKTPPRPLTQREFESVLMSYLR